MNTKYRPDFVEVAEKLTDARATVNQSIKNTEIIQSVKEKELQSDSRAKHWEQDRKKEWTSNKKYYLKGKEKVDPSKATINKIKQGGSFTSNIHPAPNYLLVKVKEEQATTDGGILLPDSQAEENNTGEIIETGEQIIFQNGKIIPMMYVKGQQILFRKFSGMNITVKGEKLLMITFNDVIALIDG